MARVYNRTFRQRVLDRLSPECDPDARHYNSEGVDVSHGYTEHNLEKITYRLQWGKNLDTDNFPETKKPAYNVEELKDKK